jgi:hypothetical protein
MTASGAMRWLLAKRGHGPPLPAESTLSTAHRSSAVTLVYSVDVSPGIRLQLSSHTRIHEQEASHDAGARDRAQRP